MALANAGLGIVHGLASVIGGLLPAPHGAVVARLLSPALRVNLEALRRRQPESPTLERMVNIGRWLAGDPRPEAAPEWTASLAEELRIPRLSEYGLTAAMIPQVVEGSSRASSTRANPIALTADEIGAILEASL
jgi:alcohol dehydrogenase class IV